MTRLIVLGGVIAAGIVSAAVGGIAQAPPLAPASASPFAIDPGPTAVAIADLMATGGRTWVSATRHHD